MRSYRRIPPVVDLVFKYFLSIQNGFILFEFVRINGHYGNGRILHHFPGYAAKDRVLVLGDMSSTGKMLQPYGKLAEDDAYATFAEQAALLTEGGVDGLIVETMIDLREALVAVRAARQACDLPVIATMSFNAVKSGLRTVMGDTPQGCAEALTQEGVCAVGANCGNLDPFQVAEVVGEMREATALPLVAQPNAGKPRLVANGTVFDMSAADFAAGIGACLQAGARLLGGCCGTSPAYIKAMIEAVGP